VGNKGKKLKGKRLQWRITSPFRIYYYECVKVLRRRMTGRFRQGGSMMPVSNPLERKRWRGFEGGLEKEVFDKGPRQRDAISRGENLQVGKNVRKGNEVRKGSERGARSC